MNAQKTMSALLRLAILGAIVTLLPSCSDKPGSTERTAIERVIRADGRTFQGLQDLKLLNATREVIYRQQKIDLQGCPQEFCDAYTAYIRAWQEQEKVLSTESSEIDRKSAGRHLEETFEEVKRFALRYGATLPTDTQRRLHADGQKEDTPKEHPAIVQTTLPAQSSVSGDGAVRGLIEDGLRLDIDKIAAKLNVIRLEIREFSIAKDDVGYVVEVIWDFGFTNTSNPRFYVKKPNWLGFSDHYKSRLRYDITGEFKREMVDSVIIKYRPK